jgi:hypothetical protein
MFRKTLAKTTSELNITTLQLTYIWFGGRTALRTGPCGGDLQDWFGQFAEHSRRKCIGIKLKRRNFDLKMISVWVKKCKGGFSHLGDSDSL